MKLFYPGTFDPITRGHLNVIRRGANLATELVVGVVGNANHKTPTLDAKTRADLVRAACHDLPNVTVVVYHGEGFPTAIQMGCGGVLRGMRSGEDFDYEQKYAQMFCEGQPTHDRLETVFLATCEKHGKTSSTMVRDLIRTGGDWQRLVPLATHELLSQNIAIFS